MFYLQGKEVQIHYYHDNTPRVIIDLKNYTKESFSKDFILLKWYYKYGEEMLLIFIKKYIDEMFPNKKVYLLVPYFPYAREDKYAHNQSFTLKYFCEMLNSLHFHKIITWDIHSNIPYGLVNRLRSFMPIYTHIPDDIMILNLFQLDECRDLLMTDIRDENKENMIVNKIIKDEKPDVLFYPDEGAMKRYQKYFNLPFIFGIKNRDFITNEIKSYDIYGEVSQNANKVLIIDDICSSGNTLVEACKLLKSKGLENVYIYVTHCELFAFTQPIIKLGYANKFFTTNSLVKETDVIHDNFYGQTIIKNLNNVKIFNCI